MQINPSTSRGLSPSILHEVGEAAIEQITSQTIASIVVEVTYLTWTEDNLLRQVSYQGQREDKPATQVVRAIPHPQRTR